MSALEQALAGYLQLRHSLGHELAEAGRLLPGFVTYLDSCGLPTVTTEAALAWAQQAPKSPAGRVTTIGPRRMTAARGFARYLSGIDASTEVPPLGLIPRRGPWRRPFIYSAADIGALLEAAGQTIVSPLRAATYQTLIGLLAASGLRIGEAIKLDRGDVGWAQGVLLIRESRFGKSRLVPLHPSRCRRSRVMPGCATAPQPGPAEPAFFVSLSPDAAAPRRRAADVPAAHRQCRHRRWRALAAEAARLCRCRLNHDLRHVTAASRRRHFGDRFAAGPRRRPVH